MPWRRLPSARRALLICLYLLILDSGMKLVAYIGIRNFVLLAEPNRCFPVRKLRNRLAPDNLSVRIFHIGIHQILLRNAVLTELEVRIFGGLFLCRIFPLNLLRLHVRILLKLQIPQNVLLRQFLRFVLRLLLCQIVQLHSFLRQIRLRCRQIGFKRSGLSIRDCVDVNLRWRKEGCSRNNASAVW